MLLSFQRHPFNTTQNRLWKAISVLLFLMALSCWNGCSSRSQDAGKDVSNLNVAVSVEISNLDPHVSASVDAIKIQSALFETLVRIDPDSGDIEAAGAKDWDVLDGGKTYRFYLEPKLKWSDGKPVVASDYVFGFRRLLNPEIGSYFAFLYEGIEGASRYVTGASNVLPGVKAVADDVLEFRLEHPVPYFLTLLARPCAAALPETYLEQMNAVNSRISGWALQSNFPTNGPYVLENWQVNKHIKLRRNVSYWRSKEVEFDVIHFYSMESAYAQERGFQTGVIDVTAKLASERVKAYQGDVHLMNDVEMGTFYIITNAESQVLNNAAKRNSLSQAIDRDLIATSIRQRGETAATSFSPPLWSHYQPHLEHVKSGEDPEWESSAKLKFLLASSETNLQIAEALQAMWQRELGVEVELVRQEWKSYLDSRRRGDFDLCLATWIGDYFDPLTFLEMWKSNAPNNYANWRSDWYDQRLAEAANAETLEARNEYLQDAESLLISDAPILPIFYLNRVYLKSDRIDRWPQTILNTVDYTRVGRK